MNARHGLLGDRFTSVLEAKDATDFRDQVLKFTKWLGFDLVGAIVGVDRAGGEADFYSVDNAPETYLQSFESKENRQRDPVSQHCKRYSTPIIWDQETYLRCGLGEKWEEQAAFGYRAGMAVVQHLPGGKHFMIGVDRDQPVPADATVQQRMAGDLSLFATFAQEAAMLLLLPSVLEAPAVRLSTRELEVLKWAAEGKTAWEVGQILGISDQTVTRHITTAMHKLGCVNKVQAVARALRLGLVH